MKKLVCTTALILGLFLLFTCTNEIDLFSEIQKEVKIANNLFLTIESVSPGDQISNVNPGNEIVIVFDRALDLKTVDSDTLQLYNDTLKSSEGFLSTRYNETTRTLSIKPTDKGYFNNLNEYIITISGFRGQDGSDLPEDYVWSFTTGLAPAGSIVAVDRGGPAALPGYTNEAVVNISVDTSNEYATRYFVSGTESDLANPGTISEDSWKLISDGFSNISIADVEGPVPVYCVFRGLISGEMAYSRIFDYEITLDKTAPVVDAGGSRISNSTITHTGSVAEPHVASYAWTGTDLTFGSPSSLTTTITATNGENDYTGRLTVTDKAGNTGFDEMVFTLDITRPATPTVNAVTATPTKDTTPTFSWSSNAGDGSGTFQVLYYSYSYESGQGSWTSSPDITTLLSYSPSIPVSGSDRYLVKLRARERDHAGNWSFYQESSDIIVSLFLPYNTQTGVSTKPTFSWPAGLKNSTYRIEVKNSFGLWITYRDNLTTTSYTVGKLDAALPSGTHTWRVVVFPPIGRSIEGPDLTFTIP